MNDYRVDTTDGFLGDVKSKRFHGRPDAFTYAEEKGSQGDESKIFDETNNGKLVAVVEVIKYDSIRGFYRYQVKYVN